MCEVLLLSSFSLTVRSIVDLGRCTVILAIMNKGKLSTLTSMFCCMNISFSFYGGKESSVEFVMVVGSCQTAVRQGCM